MRDLVTIGNNQIEKHNKYGNQYKPYSVFWGLGIEQEVYLEFENKQYISEHEFLHNHKKERYSVDYYSNYDLDILTEAFGEILRLSGSKILEIPLMLNSHSFTKTDRYGEHETIYSTKREPNKKFSGKTLIKYLEEQDKYFNQEDPTWIFDGDTIEFISVDFCNAKLSEILKEVEINKRIFMVKLNRLVEKNKIFSEYGKIKIMEQNHAFGKYLTNMDNIGMFNNGTIHLNITLPTKLNEDAKIKNKEKFISKHKNAIKLIQWLEPIIIAVYGSPDPFATLKEYSNSNKFSNCSQRNAVSRYISIGIYDTDTMEPGKILTKPLESIPMSKLDYWWFNRFHKSSAYAKLENIGLDINFNKHWNHGIEIRFLDYIADKKLVQECFEFIIYLMNLSLESELESHIFNLSNPIYGKDWNNFVYNVLVNGRDYNLSNKEKKIYNLIFSIEIKKDNIVDVYYEIFSHLKKKFNKEFVEVNKKSNSIGMGVGMGIPLGSFSKFVLDNTQIEQKQMEQIEQIEQKEISNIENNNQINLQIENIILDEQSKIDIKKNNCCIQM